MHVSRKVLTAAAMTLALLAVTPRAQAQTQVASPGQTVVTGSEGRQILFRDKTTLTAGPDSRVTVTRANYDAGAGTGNVVINVTKGAFRYVTGNTNGSHTIRTPLSTVGVRGTVIEGYVLPGGFELFILVEGAFQACSRLMCQQVTTPGTYILVNRAGTITPPATVPASFLTALMLTTPQVNLVLEQFSTVLKLGKDPMIRFTDQNTAGKTNQPLPPVPPPPPPPPKHYHHHHHHHHGYGGYGGHGGFGGYGGYGGRD